MSHLESGFCVTDLQAMAATLKEQCPDLEMVKQKTYRTWATDHGRLVGDHPLPGIYQIKLMAALNRQGVDVHALAAQHDVKLPKNLLDLEKTPWDLKDQKNLMKNEAFKQAYEKLNKEVISKDAEYVIRFKDKNRQKSSYEIGLVPHPVNKGEYQMMTDFYGQGQGLLLAQGLGRHQRTQDGKEVWGGDLKRGYAVKAAERRIQAEIMAGNPEYGSYKKTQLQDGRVKLEVFPR